MKNSICFYSIFLFSVFIFPQGIFAQKNITPMRFKLYAGASLPEGDFSSIHGEKAGYANAGFCGLIEGSKLIGESVTWVSSVSLSSNKLDDGEMERQLNGISVSAGNYITTWLMTGFGFETPASPTVKFYGHGQIGLLLSSFPDITLSYMGQSVTQTTSLGTSFAYGFGGGILINNVNLGLRYYTGEPEYVETAGNNGATSTFKAKLPATVLQLLIGINL